MGFAMGNADVDGFDAFFPGDFFGSAVQTNQRFSAAFVGNFDIGPSDADDPTGAERFEYGFFGRPATGEVLIAAFSFGAVLNFFFGEDPFDEMIAVFLDHAINPLTFDDIGPDSQNVHDISPPQRAGDCIPGIVPEFRRYGVVESRNISTTDFAIWSG